MPSSLTWTLKRIHRRLFPMRWRRRLFPMRRLRVRKNKPVLLVVLLRKPHLLSEEELRAAAEKAWGLSFAESDGSTRYVVTSGDARVLNAGQHLLSFHSSNEPYVAVPKDDLSWLPKASQQRAWAEHSACLYVYYLTPGTDFELAHCILAKVLAQLLDSNCTGLYSPDEDGLIPADESFYEQLQAMASSRDSHLLAAL